eukprot:TRINITY_DN4088_c0_g1_i1.p1 TRINITY_DN4088_c0_g1~~TRINITY_DN4088_c0_g1_i1.p1  ORF type:complete len:488 (-),score=134.32 TRINITY_DN4088_c0_g1_i1:455-1807(-)
MLSNSNSGSALGKMSGVMAKLSLPGVSSGNNMLDKIRLQRRRLKKDDGVDSKQLDSLLLQTEYCNTLQEDEDVYKPVEIQTSSVLAGLRWEKLGDSNADTKINLDLVVTAVDALGNVVAHVDGRPTKNKAFGGSIVHSGDDTIGGEESSFKSLMGDNETVFIDLQLLPDNIETIFLSILHGVGSDASRFDGYFRAVPVNKVNSTVNPIVAESLRRKANAEDGEDFATITLNEDEFGSAKSCVVARLLRTKPDAKWWLYPLRKFENAASFDDVDRLLSTKYHPPACYLERSESLVFSEPIDIQLYVFDRFKHVYSTSTVPKTTRFDLRNYFDENYSVTDVYVAYRPHDAHKHSKSIEFNASSSRFSFTTNAKMEQILFSASRCLRRPGNTTFILQKRVFVQAHFVSLSHVGSDTASVVDLIRSIDLGEADHTLTVKVIQELPVNRTENLNR